MTTLIDRQYEFEADDGQTILMGAGTDIRVITVDGLISQPEQRTQDTPHSGREGATSSAEDFYEARRIVMAVGVEAKTQEEGEVKLDELHSVLHKGNLGTLSMKRPGKVQRQCQSKVRRAEFQANWDVVTGWTAGGLEFYCPDPRMYGGDISMLSTTVGSEIGGRTYPGIYNPGRTYASTVEGGAMVFVNEGNMESPPLIRLYGPSQNPTLIHVEQGITMSFNIVLLSTDVLEVDLRNHTIILNGTSSRRGILTTHAWFTLLPGSNQIRYLATLGAGSHVEMECQSAWSTA